MSTISPTFMQGRTPRLRCFRFFAARFTCDSTAFDQRSRIMSWMPSSGARKSSSLMSAALTASTPSHAMCLMTVLGASPVNNSMGIRLSRLLTGICLLRHSCIAGCHAGQSLMSVLVVCNIAFVARRNSLFRRSATLPHWRYGARMWC